MGITIVFLSSLFAISVLLGIKVVELKRGIKPLSASRYRLDGYLRKKADVAVNFARYFNAQTAKLIVFFVLTELKDGVVYLARKVRESYLGDMVSGKNIPRGSKLESSAYLKQISSVKVESRDSSK